MKIIVNFWDNKNKRYSFGRFGILLNRIIGYIIIVFGIFMLLAGGLTNLINTSQSYGLSGTFTFSFFSTLISVFGPILTGITFLIFADVIEAILDAGNNSFRR